MPPPLQSSGVIACGNDRSDEGIAPYDCTGALHGRGHYLGRIKNIPDRSLGQG